MANYLLEIEGKSKYLVKVTQKRMKSLRLKINTNGEIFLSTPMRFSKLEAKKFVESKLDWIEKSSQKMSQSKIDQPTNFEQGDEIYIWGEKRIINIISSSKNSVDLDGQFLNIYLNSPTNQNAKKVFLSWAKNYFFGHLIDMYEIVYRTIFKKLKVSKPQLTIRTMKSMWGNCKYNKEVVTLNFYLFKTPIPCINYVILHELAHMIFHDHGTGFKNFLTTYMPDWKERKKELNKFSLQF